MYCTYLRDVLYVFTGCVPRLSVWFSSYVHMGRRYPSSRSKFNNDWYIHWTVCHGSKLILVVNEGLVSIEVMCYELWAGFHNQGFTLSVYQGFTLSVYQGFTLRVYHGFTLSSLSRIYP